MLVKQGEEIYCAPILEEIKWSHADNWMWPNHADWTPIGPIFWSKTLITYPTQTTGAAQMSLKEYIFIFDQSNREFTPIGINPAPPAPIGFSPAQRVGIPLWSKQEKINPTSWMYIYDICQKRNCKQYGKQMGTIHGLGRANVGLTWADTGTGFHEFST